MHARTIFLITSTVALATTGVAAVYWAPALWALVPVGAVVTLGLYDMVQTRHAVRRNYPVLGKLRYIFESVRPELQQYFVESNSSGRPFSREMRSLAYRRAKNVIDTHPFGTERDLYETGYEWFNPSLVAKVPSSDPPRVRIGGEDCKQPYDAALLNISAMSYGSLSKNATRALNRGAKLGGFAQNTGEGGLSPYHLEGGDLIWQVGTGYFGCRDARGDFSPDDFARRASLESVKMIEIKLSQGAKPGHGGMLPASKVTEEVAEIRSVPLGQDVLSPPTHSAFTTPIELCRFIGELRQLSGGKPIGFKLCVGKRREFLALCKAMLETGVRPDFITVDGGEGGTGAAPLEFSNVLGSPLREGLIFVHNALTGIGVRESVRVIASGRIISGFDMAHKIAIGADLCYSARAMMFALGCIQAQKCNTNDCPTGVATQDKSLSRGLVVSDKGPRVWNLQRNTVQAFSELIGATGLEHPSQLRPWHVHRRIGPTQVKHYGDIYEYLAPGSLLQEPLPESFARAWNSASAHSFDSTADTPQPARSKAPEPARLES